MRIGAHVRAGGSLVGALERAHEIGADAVQVFTQSPRMWKPAQYSPAVLEAYRAAASADAAVSATYCHATYLINLATDDPALFERSWDCLLANRVAALGMGASGLVLHVGSHRGRGFERCVTQVADALRMALDKAKDPLGEDTPAEACPILLKNTAGAGGTVGRSFDELAEIIDRVGAGPALGVCLDTQHLWASGVEFGSPASAEEVVALMDATVGLRSLGCLHLNDSKVERGAHRDRHENVGEGMIGASALGCLLAHPAMGDRVAILEVPGDGHGPRAEDVVAARRSLVAGRRRWSRATRVAGAATTRSARPPNAPDPRSTRPAGVASGRPTDAG